MTILIQHVMKHSQQLTRMKMGGIVAGFAGVFITALGTNRFGILSSQTLIGIASILVGSFSFSLYTILSKSHQKKYDPLHLTYTVTILGSILILPFFVADYMYHPYFNLLTSRHIVSLVATALIGTVLFYSIYQYAIKHTDPTTASLFSYIQPVFAVALSIILVGESITALFVMGSIITLGGAYLATKK